MSQAYAKIKLQRISASKANLVAQLFRNKSIVEAVSILQNTPKKSAKIFLKLLNSAIANATNNHGLNAEKLIVKEVLVNQGPTLKRSQPRAKGQVYPILKRTSSLTIKLIERKKS